MLFGHHLLLFIQKILYIYQCYLFSLSNKCVIASNYIYSIYLKLFILIYLFLLFCCYSLFTLLFCYYILFTMLFIIIDYLFCYVSYSLFIVLFILFIYIYSTFTNYFSVIMNNQLNSYINELQPFHSKIAF